jgi:hypothetical protein
MAAQAGSQRHNDSRGADRLDPVDAKRGTARLCSQRRTDVDAVMNFNRESRKRNQQR